MDLYKDEDYELLEKALDYSQCICPPDEYQYRINSVMRYIATFLLKPYHERKKQEKDVTAAEEQGLFDAK